MEGISGETLVELHGAYLCLKDSIEDDLISFEELKLVLQYAGFSPSLEFLNRNWIEGKTKSITYSKFCSLTRQLPDIDETEIKKLISNVFIVSGNSFQVKDLKSVIQMTKKEHIINDEVLSSLIEETEGQNGILNVDKLCSAIDGTIKKLKEYSANNLEQHSSDNRVKKRTFTKTEVNSQLHSFNRKSSIDVKDWHSTMLKGALFIDNDIIISHQYSLELSCIGQTVIKIMPLKFTSSVLSVDILAFIFRETSDGNKTFIGYTNTRNEDGSNLWMDTLKEGKYVIIPYTTGCIKTKTRRKESSSIQIIDKNEKIELTTDCIRLLEDIFYQMDLDNNSLLNRQEFNLYNWRTSGEIVEDDEWDIVQKNFDVQDGEVTLKGFLSLHQLEAEDNGGDSEELWVSLETIGYNRFGYQDRCSPFSLTVYSQICDPALLVSGLKSGGLLIDKAVIRSIMEEADPININDRSDILKFQLYKEYWASIVIQNKSSEKVKVQVDCSDSDNCFSNRESLIWQGEIDPKSAVAAHHLAPINNAKPWSVKSKETILKH